MMRGLFLVFMFPFVLGSATPAHAQEEVAPQNDWMVHMDRGTGEWRYVPARIVLVPGGTVQLMVFGNGQFSLTLDDGTRDADISSETGTIRTAEFPAPATPGEYPFYDKYHPEARGVLVVRQKAEGSAARPTIGVVPGGYESQFSPGELRVAPGAEVLFRANGSFGHNLQAVDGSFSAGDLRAGEERAFTAPITPGEYAFECKFHKDLGMTGLLIVEEGAPGAPPTDPIPPPEDEAPVEANEAGIVLTDNEIMPRILRANAGATITVHNAGGTPHTLTAQDGSFDTDRIEPGEAKTITLPSTPGTIHVYCRYHAAPDSRPEDAMAGDIEVLAASTTPAPASSGPPPSNETPLAPAMTLLACLAALALVRLRRPS